MVWRLERPLTKCAVCKVQTTGTEKVNFVAAFQDEHMNLLVFEWLDV